MDEGKTVKSATRLRTSLKQLSRRHIFTNACCRPFVRHGYDALESIFDQLVNLLVQTFISGTMTSKLSSSLSDLFPSQVVDLLSKFPKCFPSILIDKLHAFQ